MMSTKEVYSKMSKFIPRSMLNLSTLYAFVILLLILLVQQQPVGCDAFVVKPKVGPKIVIRPSDPLFKIDITKPSEQGLTCATEGDQPELFSDLRWTGPNLSWEELKKRHKTREVGKGLRLTFINPSREDSGYYYCHGKYHSQDNYNASIEVKFFEPIKLENCNQRQFLVKGSTNSKISCRVTAVGLQVELLKDGKEVNRKRYKWDNEDGLTIDGSVEDSDSGVYTISSYSSETGLQSDVTIDVEVHSKPELMPYIGPDPKSEFYGVEDEPATLMCNATGNPKPLIYWYSPNRKNLTEDGGYNVIPEEGKLQIKKVRREDDHGAFECKAVNDVGPAFRKVYMYVDTKPIIKSFNNVTVTEGSEVTLECRSTGDPQPHFSIRKEGINQVPYREGDEIYQSSNTDPEGGGSNLFVHRLRVKATRSMFGQHFCNATSRAGTAEKSNFIHVNHPPDLTATPPQQFVKMGNEFTLNCHVVAYPLPTITWYIGQQQVVNAVINIKTTPDGHTHFITMTPPNQQQYQNSKYTCEAKNILGTSRQDIEARHTTAPGPVGVSLVNRGPTTVTLSLLVLNDGGAIVRNFRYTLMGKTQDQHNPVFEYRTDWKNETSLPASPNPSAIYTIRNLLPYYTYTIRIRAENEVGLGDEVTWTFSTPVATAPDPPIIVKPSTSTTSHSFSGHRSDYNNGYTLRWSPPELDNGDPIIKYIIRFGRIEGDSLPYEEVQERVVEQMNERPLYAHLGPLISNQRYKIEIQAGNKLGDSRPDTIIIYTSKDKPPMPEFESQALSWLVAPSSPTLILILVLAVVFLIISDLIFCFCFQMGLTHWLRTWCCPAKPNSVISDKNYS